MTEQKQKTFSRTCSSGLPGGSEGGQRRRPEGGSVFYFDIEFEDGLKGQFSTNKREQTKFVAGNEYDYEETTAIFTGAKDGHSATACA